MLLPEALRPLDAGAPAGAPKCYCLRH